MKIFHHLSLYSKILLTILFLTLSVSFFSTALFIDKDKSRYQNIISLFSEIIDGGSAIASAVVENDDTTIQKKLVTLRINPNILSVEIFLMKGETFEKAYDPPTKEVNNTLPSNLIDIGNEDKTERYLFKFFNQKIEIMYPIIKQGNLIGGILIKANNAGTYLYSLFEMITLISIIAIFIAMYLSDIITAPLTSLVEVMKTVTSQNDYTVRIHEKRNDEFGILNNTFNRMLDTIEHNEKLQRTSQEEIKRLLYHDTLTGLPNRDLFIELMQQTLSQAKLKRTVVGVFYLDLDNFKRINNELGKNSGDIFLQKIADILKEYHPKANKSIDIKYNHDETETLVARLNSDEFIISFTNIHTTEEAENIAEELTKFTCQPYHINGKQITGTISIGIALYPYHGETTEELLKNAEIAMYLAKESGKKSFKVFDNKLSKTIANKQKFESDLFNCIERNELALYYQPKYHLVQQRLSGLEGLLRWVHSETGLVMPDEFIPLAESNGFIIELGDWVLKEGCKQCQQWHKAGYGNLSISLNLSARQFTDPTLVQRVESALKGSGLNPQFLELELTESMIMMSDEKTLNTLHALKELGLTISLDDFGTGYSSLRYLSKYPLNTIKIDKSFITYLIENENNAMITRTIIDLAHNLNLQVIAEGVETLDQLHYLKNNECDQIQGYLIGRPMSVKEITHFLAQHQGKLYETRNKGGEFNLDHLFNLWNDITLLRLTYHFNYDWIWRHALHSST